MGDDTYEENESLARRPRTSALASAPVAIPNLVWRDNDVYQFTVPPGGGSASIRSTSGRRPPTSTCGSTTPVGDIVGASLGFVEDFEVVNVAVNAGSTYYISVEPGLDVSPAFYDLSFEVNAPDVITVTDGPRGSPNPAWRPAAGQSDRVGRRIRSAIR